MQKALRIFLLILIIIGLILIFTQKIWVPKLVDQILSSEKIPTNTTNESLVTYNNTDYGFTFSLPETWKGYSIVHNTWQGSPLNTTQKETGPKLLIRNPNWTSAVHYEDIPILIFTLAQWDSYTKENFAVSAAPISATELARNNLYVFALPPRWDYDYSKGFEEAQNILKNNPIKTFDIKNGSTTDFIRLDTPLPNQNIQSPLIIKGSARGSWFFEASFPVVLVNWDGLIIAQGIAQAKGDWMTTEFVPFEANLTFTVDKNAYSNKGTLILLKDNPSGIKEKDDSIEIPVTLSE